MTPRESLIAVLEGGIPDTTPLTVYDWNMGAVTADELAEKMRQPAWKRLIEQGLTVRCHCPVVKAVEHGVEYEVEEREVDGAVLRRETKTTPVGRIERMTRDGWHSEDWIKSPIDYKVQQWIVERTELAADYDAYARAEEVVGDRGVVVLTGAGNWQHRSPAMCINIDLAGTERFCTDVALELPELADLYDALWSQFLEEQRLIAAGPGRYVAWFENLTINMLGPRRYGELLVPVYEKAVPMQTAGDKRVMVHYDGQLKVIADQIAAAPYAIVDSLTESPEGDMSLRRVPSAVAQARILGQHQRRPLPPPGRGASRGGHRQTRASWKARTRIRNLRGPSDHLGRVDPGRAANIGGIGVTSPLDHKHDRFQPEGAVHTNPVQHCHHLRGEHHAEKHPPAIGNRLDITGRSVVASWKAACRRHVLCGPEWKRCTCWNRPTTVCHNPPGSSSCP